MFDRPRYLYHKSSAGQSYPVRPIWWREWYPLKKHYRVLDCADTYDYDDYYKLEFSVGSGFFEYLRPDERAKLAALKRARLKAEAIVREIDCYKRARDWRKRLQRVSHDFEFVFEPYRQKLQQQYGQRWRYDTPIIFKARKQRQQRLARISPDKQRSWREVRLPMSPPPTSTASPLQAIAVVRQAAVRGVILPAEEWAWWREFIAQHEAEIEQELLDAQQRRNVKVQAG